MTKDKTSSCSNWEAIVSEYYELIGMVYEEERTGEYFRFFGLVHGDDDYYYGMMGIDGAGMRLLSCVGSIENFGFNLVKDFVEKTCPTCGKESLKPMTYSDIFGKGVLVKDIEAYDCKNCHNIYHTPQQDRAKFDKIIEAHNKAGL